MCRALKTYVYDPIATATWYHQLLIFFLRRLYFQLDLTDLSEVRVVSEFWRWHVHVHSLVVRRYDVCVVMMLFVVAKLLVFQCSEHIRFPGIHSVKFRWNLRYLWPFLYTWEFLCFHSTIETKWCICTEKDFDCERHHKCINQNISK